MDFYKVCFELLNEFDQEEVDYAVIGGFALGFWGVTRATVDLDCLLSLEDAPRADAIFLRHGYRQTYRSENVCQYRSVDADYGTIDVIFAFREHATQMLARSVQVRLTDGVHVRSLVPEDIIGLKVQAIANNPDRRDRDLADIHGLLRARRAIGDSIDWHLLDEYFRLFGIEAMLAEMKGAYGNSE